MDITVIKLLARMLSSTQTSTNQSTGTVGSSDTFPFHPKELEANISDSEYVKQLEKATFDLKMKLFHMQQQQQSSRTSSQAFDHDSQTTLQLQRTVMAQLEQKEKELDQKNALLAKAKGLIDLLKLENRNLQQSHENEVEVKQQLEELRHRHEEVELEFRKQCIEHDVQMKSIQSHLLTKEQEVSLLEDQLQNLDVSYQQMYEKFKEANKESILLQDKYSKSHQLVSQLEDELIQQKTHVSLLSDQLLESSQSNQRANERIARLQELNQQNTTEIVHKYEERIASMKASQQEELISLKRELQQSLIHCEDLKSMKSLMESRCSTMETLEQATDNYRMRLQEASHAIEELEIYKKDLEKQLEDSKLRSVESEKKLSDLQNSRLQASENELRFNNLLASITPAFSSWSQIIDEVLEASVSPRISLSNPVEANDVVIRSLIQINELNGKFDRLVKLRNIWFSKVQQLESIYNATVSRYDLKLDELNIAFTQQKHKLEDVRNIFLRDKEQHDSELSEMTALRTEILHLNSKNIEEIEKKFTLLLVEHQKLQDSLRSSASLIEKLQSENSELAVSNAAFIRDQQSWRETTGSLEELRRMYDQLSKDHVLKCHELENAQSERDDERHNHDKIQKIRDECEARLESFMQRTQESLSSLHNRSSAQSEKVIRLTLQIESLQQRHQHDLYQSQRNLDDALKKIDAISTQKNTRIIQLEEQLRQQDILLRKLEEENDSLRQQNSDYQNEIVLLRMRTKNFDETKATVDLLEVRLDELSSSLNVSSKSENDLRSPVSRSIVFDHRKNHEVDFLSPKSQPAALHRDDLLMSSSKGLDNRSRTSSSFSKPFASSFASMSSELTELGRKLDNLSLTARNRRSGTFRIS